KTDIFTYNCPNENILNKYIETLNNILNRINDTIKTAHRYYNEYLVEHYNGKHTYKCTCDNKDCTINLTDNRTTGCDRKTVWTDEGIDYVNGEFTLDSKDPVGYITFL